MTTAGIFLLPNGTFFVELIVFIVLIMIIGKKIIPPVTGAMAERQERIRASLDAADQARADATAADDERRAVLEEARQYFFITVGLVEAMYFINLLFMVVFVYVFAAKSVK